MADRFYRYGITRAEITKDVTYEVPWTRGFQYARGAQAMYDFGTVGTFQGAIENKALALPDNPWGWKAWRLSERTPNASFYMSRFIEAKVKSDRQAALRGDLRRLPDSVRTALETAVSTEFGVRAPRAQELIDRWLKVMLAHISE